MTIDDIERRLADARARLQSATSALAPKHKGGEWEEYRSARDAALRLERELAAAKGEEHAVPLNFPVKWDTGAPLPHLLQNDHKAFLTFYVRVPDPAWDGTYATVKYVNSGEEESLALVELVGCISARLGSPNDEVLEGHPLYGKGLDGQAQEVVSSRLLAELEAINKVHRCYDPASWKKRKHFIFWFHDTTFECVAESFKVELFRESMQALLARASARLLGTSAD